MNLRPALRRWLERRSRAAVALGSVALVLALGLADLATSEEFSLAVFYLVPVLGATWLVGRRAGLLLAALSALTAVTTSLYSGSAGPTAVHLWNFAMLLGFFGVAAALHHALKRALERERSLARHDPLTGLSNRTAFVEAAEVEIARSHRYERPLTVAYLDCDHFKEVNDTHGHQAGDRVLWLVGHTLQKCIRKTDTAARLGGDEFALLFPELSAAEAREVMTKVQARLLMAMREAGFPVTFSIGVVSYKRSPATLDALLWRADQLMFEVKRSGRNSVRFEAASGTTDPGIRLRSAS